MATYTNPDGRVFTIPTYSDLSDGPQNFKDFAATMPSYGNDIYNVSDTVQFTAHHISRVLRYTAAGEYVVDDTAATGTQVAIATGNAFVSVMTSGVQVEPATERLIPPYSMVILTKVGVGMWLVAKGSGGVGNYFNNATGGTVTEVQNYNGTGELWRVHTFTGNGSFEVLDSQQPFRVAAIGGGGGGRRHNCHNSGGGGQFTDTDYTIPVGAHSVSIGGGGNGGSGGAGTYCQTGSNGGAVSLGSVMTMAGGKAGGTGGENYTERTTNILGSNVTWGGGSPTNNNGNRPGRGGGAGNGDGGSGGAYYGSRGYRGELIVAYQIG